MCTTAGTPPDSNQTRAVICSGLLGGDRCKPRPAPLSFRFQQTAHFVPSHCHRNSAALAANASIMSAPRCFRFIILLTIVMRLANTALLSGTLKCVQCDRSVLYYDSTRNKSARKDCLLGLVEPTPCANASATHCIANFYKEGISSKRTVTMRKCGTAQDVVGCTLYKFPRENRLTPNRVARDGRMRRSPHKFDDGSAASAPLIELIEVCAEGCTTDGCLVASVNSATRPPPPLPLLPLMLWPFAALIFRLLPITDA
uniref:Uncharacterized protein n=2 Tax=Plectus sambesii TaxID=2011161 RepID=A0A914UZR8_9BILA